MIRAEILTIGTELLRGTTLDTNSAFIAQSLCAIGIACMRRTSVPDENTAVESALKEILGRCEVLIITGGLGPTCDDMTIASLAKATGRPLIYQPAIGRLIRRYYKRHNRKLQQDALRQAYLPKGAITLNNALGTAPGLWLEHAKTTLIALPGVPSEMQELMEQSVLPRLKKLKGLAVDQTLTLRTAGIVELQIEHMLRRINLPDSVQVGLYPHLKTVDVNLTCVGMRTSEARVVLRKIEKQLRRRLGSAVYGTGDQRMEGVIGERLLKQKRTLAIAESCTGGIICDRLTNIPGSSRYLRGGIVAYHNDLKADLLGVSGHLLARRGAVSAEGARAMAEGVRTKIGASIGLSITGIAGPSGGTPAKPVGLVFIGLSDARASLTWRHQFYGTRETVKAQAAQTALNTLRLYLMGDSSAVKTPL